MNSRTWMVTSFAICVTLFSFAGLAAGQATTSMLSLDGDGWQLATDPQNVGRDQKWFEAPRPEAKPAKVPWIIQETFPAYHGVAWYWHEFAAPANPHPGGRYLLRFWRVDYLAEVWLNGAPVGGHEGGETPFVLDVTDRIKPGEKNQLAVRVLNPTNELIDGIRLKETPRRIKAIPFVAGSGFNYGGITDSVELLCVPAVYVDDLFVVARAEKTDGKFHIQSTVRNAATQPRKGHLDITVSAATSGETIATQRIEREFPAGNSLVEADVAINNPRLWWLNDPYLYRVTARVSIEGASSFDERSTRTGFRDFRFADGYFRLNGKRIYLRCTHTYNEYPIGQHIPQDPDLLRRDLLNLKVMGFNTVRFIWGGASRGQLDLCDEIGLMVYEESYAGQWMDPSPKLAERFNNAVSEVIRRDRNHPSIVIWGLLNETPVGHPALQHALTMLPMIRSLDDTRIVMLNSGCKGGRGLSLDHGGMSNPGSVVWEDLVADRHVYPRVPHVQQDVRLLRHLTAADTDQHVFFSEYGVGCAVDLWRATRHFEQRGATALEDAQFFREKLDRFLVDWKQWRMDEVFGRPEDFFTESLKKLAGQRTLGVSAVRANTNFVGYSLTGATDQAMCGEGLTTHFRELKPGTVDAMFDTLAPLRWCVFALPPDGSLEASHIYRGGKVHLEAVLANEDVLPPGEYPALVQVIGPSQNHVLDRTIAVKVLPPEGKQERPFAQLCFVDDVVVDGPSGKYRFLVSFQHGGAATGGEAEFYVTDPAEMPTVETEVVLWGDDPQLAQWLKGHGIRTRPFAAAAPASREVILASSKPESPGGAQAFAELARRMATGSTVIFLSPEVFADGDKPTAWLPLAQKGTLTDLGIWGGLYMKDEWAKRHSIFEGLLAGGLMDYTYYREMIPTLVWQGQNPPAEAVAGATKASQDYSAGLLVSVYNLGAGRFVLNTLRIRENLGNHPTAERLLRNMLRYAARDVDQPVASLPADFDQQLSTWSLK